MLAKIFLMLVFVSIFTLISVAGGALFALGPGAISRVVLKKTSLV